MTNNKELKNQMKEEKKSIKKEIKKDTKKGGWKETKKELKGESLQRFLLMKNPYARSILDPFNCRGAQIPDMESYPSVPFTMVDRRTITVNPSGVCAFSVGNCTRALGQVSGGSLVPTKFTINSVAFDYFYGQINGGGTSTGISTNLFPAVDSGAATTDIAFPKWNSASSSIPATFQKVRLVSLGVNLQFTGNFQTNQGKMSACVVPPGYFKTLGQQNNISVNMIETAPQSKIIPVSANQGITLIWHPQDIGVQQYTNVSNDQGPITHLIATSGDYKQQTLAGELLIAITGAEPGTVFQATIVGNYEGIALKNDFIMDLPSFHSKSDPIANSHAMNVAEKAPTVVEGSKAVNKSVSEINSEFHAYPTDSSTQPRKRVESEPTLFDDILEGIGKTSDTVLDIANKATPIIEKVLKFL